MSKIFIKTIFTVVFIMHSFVLGQENSTKIFNSEYAASMCEIFKQSNITSTQVNFFIEWLKTISLENKETKNAQTMSDAEKEKMFMDAFSLIQTKFKGQNIQPEILFPFTSILLSVKWGVNGEVISSQQIEIQREIMSQELVKLAQWVEDSTTTTSKSNKSNSINTRNVQMDSLQMQATIDSSLTPRNSETVNVDSIPIDPAQALRDVIAKSMSSTSLETLKKMNEENLELAKKQQEVYKEMALAALQQQNEEREKYNNPTDKLMWMLSSAESLVYDSVLVYLEQGADIHAMTSNYLHRPVMTPLMAVTKRGNYELVKLMLESGADVNKTDLEGRTALMLASIPFRRGYEVNMSRSAKYHDNRLRTTSKHVRDNILKKELRYLNICKLLLNAGANINAVSDSNATALFYAATYDCYGHVKFLLSNGADINKGVNPLANNIERLPFESPVVPHLINAGIDVDDPNEQGNTALHLLSLHHNYSSDVRYLINLLIEKGANVNAVNNNGSTVLHLISKDINLDLKRMKILVPLLLNSGLNVNLMDNKGFTALDYAIKYVCMHLKNYCEILIKHGAIRGNNNK